jgi:signal transduction histidine kinase
MALSFSIAFQFVDIIFDVGDTLVLADKVSEAKVKDSDSVRFQVMHDIIYSYRNATKTYDADVDGYYYTESVSEDATFGVYHGGKLVYGKDIKDKALSGDFGVAVIGGEVHTTEKLSGVLDYITDDGKFSYDDYKKSYDIYVLYEQEEGVYGTSLINNYNKFIGYKSFSVYRNAIIFLILFILSIGLAVYTCVVCGNREDGKIKLAFIDYIPVDVHFVASGGLIAGAVYLIWAIGETYFYYTESGYYSLCRFGMSALAGAIWAILLEFLTSFIRVCKSERKFYDCCLGLFLIKVIIVKPFKALFKVMFTYKPNYIKRIAIRTIVLYLLFVLLDFALAFVFALSDYPELIIVCAVLLLAVTVVGAVFAVRYMVYLDKIITSANNRTPLQLDYNRLPQSLKVLASSFQYTRYELNAAVDRAVKDERMRTELITNVSHDLRTPLTSIITYVDLLKQCDVKDDNAREYIEVLDDKGKRLKRLIDDLIEASKITSGVIQLNPVMLSLSELAAQAIYERQQEFIDSKLEVVFKGDKNQVSCFADGNKTFRILDNLLSNARKYSARGTRVYCDVYEYQDYAVFEIKNISAQQLDITPQELTERFVRGDRSRNADGNGLGLSIADNLCKAQGGELYLTIDGDLFKAQVMLPKHN